MSVREKDQKKEYLMYMHAGSANHGCEAIIRSLKIILGGQCSVISNRAGEDTAVGLDDICDIIPAAHYENNPVLKACYYALRRLTHRSDAQMDYSYAAAKPYERFCMAMSVGGDNYCYDDALVNLRGANRLFNKHNVPTALVGCSVEPGILDRTDVICDLAAYRCIIARESLTYEALRSALPGTMRDDIYMIPDPAFALPAIRCELPAGFKSGHTIGINISPMLLNYEAQGARGAALKNYAHLIDTIIEETDDMIALIPHVTTAFSDDRIPMRSLFDMFADTGRVIEISDAPASVLKYIISNLRLMITARTHASIAAYSTYVPTLVVGYSVKAAGIAKDLFGTHEGYVRTVQSLRDTTDLTEAYRWLETHADEQRNILREKIPVWIAHTEEIRGILDRYTV